LEETELELDIILVGHNLCWLIPASLLEWNNKVKLAVILVITVHGPTGQVVLFHVEEGQLVDPVLINVLITKMKKWPVVTNNAVPDGMNGLNGEHALSVAVGVLSNAYGTMCAHLSTARNKPVAATLNFLNSPITNGLSGQHALPPVRVVLHLEQLSIFVVLHQQEKLKHVVHLVFGWSGHSGQHAQLLVVSDRKAEIEEIVVEIHTPRQKLPIVMGDQVCTLNGLNGVSVVNLVPVEIKNDSNSIIVAPKLWSRNEHAVNHDGDCGQPGQPVQHHVQVVLLTGQRLNFVVNKKNEKKKIVVKKEDILTGHLGLCAQMNVKEVSVDEIVFILVLWLTKNRSKTVVDQHIMVNGVSGQDASARTVNKFFVAVV